MKDIDCCKDCKKRGTDCHGDVFYYNSSPICREFISDEPSVWEENTMLEEEIAVLKEKYRWHDAREEKPTEKCRYILATIKDKVIVVGVSINHMEDTVQIQDYEKPIVFETKDGWSHGWNQVVRWMPLPDIPKEPKL